MNLTLDREVYDAALKVWQFLEDSGHLECGSWSQDLADPSGTVTCACGSRFVPVVREAISCTVIPAGGGQ